MRKRLLILPAAGLLLAALALHSRAGDLPPARCPEAGRAPHLRPDYSGVVVPPNIAPLNFVVAEPGRRCAVRASGPAGAPVWAAGGAMQARFPAAPWRRLLTANRGREIRFDVYVRGAAGGWAHFAPVTNRVAEEKVDPVLVCRRLPPVFNQWLNLGITQRDLESFSERAVLDNRMLGYDCLNCHTFLGNRPDTFLFHTRPGQASHNGPGMVVVRGGKAQRIDVKAAGSSGPAVYTSWHPSGRWLAFSVDKIRQFFHTAGAEPRDVYALKSGIAVYSFDTGKASMPPALNRPDRLNTFPAWDSDGKRLYYASAPAAPAGSAPAPQAASRARYDLARIPFDPDTGAWGQPETVLAASAAGKSVLEPRVSPDGKWVLVTLCDNGSFPIHQQRSDLCLIALEKGFPRHFLDSGPESQRDSWHCWSSSGRWLVFSRKRDTKLLARPFLRYVDVQGNAAKAFVVPQEDPTYYDRCLDTFNAPELVTGPVRIDPRALADAASAGEAR